MINVIAIITAHPGKRDELLKVFTEVVPLVHQEKGYIEYEPVTDTDNEGSQAKIGEDSYMVIEKWETMDDLRAHSASSHMAEFGKKAGHLIADRKVYVLD